MKNKSQTTMYIVLLVGVLFTFIAYLYVAKPSKTKAEKLEASNKVLKERVDSIKEYYDNIETYKKEISEKTLDIKNMIKPFPADAKEEDILMLAINTITDDTLIGYKTINVGPREIMDTISQEEVQAANIEGLDQELIFRSRVTEYENITNYVYLKGIVDIINSNENNVAISQISYKYDKDKDYLDGAITVTFYSALGTGKEYVPLKLPEYELGTVNLFGTMESKNEQQK